MVNNSYPLYSKTKNWPHCIHHHTSTFLLFPSHRRMLKEYASPNPKRLTPYEPTPIQYHLAANGIFPKFKIDVSFLLRVTRLFVLSTPGWVPSASSSTTVSATERTDGLAPHSKKCWHFTPKKCGSIQKNGEVSKFFISSVAVTAMRFPTGGPFRPVSTRLVPVVACHGTRHCDLQGTKAVDGATSWENHRTNVGKTMENKPHPWLGMVVTYHLRKWWWLGDGLWHCFTHSRWSTRFSTWMSCLFIQKSRDQEVLAYGLKCGHPKSVVSTRKTMEKPRVLGSTLFSGQPNILNEFISPCLVVSTSTPQCLAASSRTAGISDTLPASDRVTLGLSPQKDPNWSCPGKMSAVVRLWSSISGGSSLVFRSKQVGLHTKLGCLLATGHHCLKVT